MQSIDMLNEAESAFKESIKYGEKSLMVHCKRVYQMIDMGDKFLFAEVRGFEGEGIDAVSCFDDMTLDCTKKRKKFTINKCDIIKAEVFGKYNDYFTLNGVKVILYSQKGRRKKSLSLQLFGEINQFVLRDFLSGISGNIKFNSDEKSYENHFKIDKNESSAYRGLMVYFNSKCRAVNRLMCFLALLSVALIFVSVYPDILCSDIIKGISTLLLLVIFLLYIKYHRLFYFISSNGVAQSKYERKRAECFGTVIIPTIFAMLASVFSFGTILEFGKYIVISLIAAAAMTALFLMFTSEYRTKYRLIFICAVMCVIYSFVAVNDVNKMYSVESIENYQTVVTDKRESLRGKPGKSYYFSVKLRGGELKEITVKEDVYKTIVKEKTIVNVSEHRGVLGIVCVDVEIEPSE